MHTVRYAHCEGYTDICYGDNGKYITTGEDGDVRIWNGFDDTDNTSIRVGDKCFAIAYKSGKIYVSDELNELKKYDLETQEFQGVITSFTLPITSIAVNKSNTHLVCGSSDFEIHLIDLATLKVSQFSGHMAPILSLCYDPLEKYFVSSSCDGTCRFWSIQNLNTVKTLSNLHQKSNDFIDSVSWCRIAWHKDGGLIAVPCEKEIHFYERETWLQKFKISIQNESTDQFNVSIICFSPDGKYVMATTNTQNVYIHSIINKSQVFKYSYKKNVKLCSLAWNPTNQNEVLFCDMNGYMGQIKVSIKDDINNSQPAVVETTKKSTSSTKKSTTSKNDDYLPEEDLLDLLGDNDSNDSNQDVIKSPNKKRKRLSDDEESVQSSNNNNKKDEIMSDMGDDNDDDLESLEKLKLKTYNSVKKDVMSMDYPEEDDENSKLTTDTDFHHHRLMNEKKLDQITTQVLNLQPAFQPASTPITCPERFMTWNNIGLITQFNKENDDSIDIEFHEASYHHTIHLKNQVGYTMGDVSKSVVVLASPGKDSKKDDEENVNEIIPTTSQSKLTCILLNTNDNTKEWSIDMLRKEYIRCICAGNAFVACATSRKFMRIYCTAGTQKEIIQIPGVPLCISSYSNCIFLAYHISHMTIGYSLYYIDDATHRETENGILPLTDSSKLEWIGFSDEGNPYCYDSNGYLFTKCLTVSKVRAWTPISNLKASLNHKSDNYWIVGISERNQMIKAILCRGSKYPNVLPKPNIAIVNFNIPLTEPESEKTGLERDYWKNKYLSMSVSNYDCNSEIIQNMNEEELQEKVDEFESSSREVLMKLFMLACKNSKEQRAYEIATIMDSMALQLAIKYATKTRALVLAQNLNILAENKAQVEAEKERINQENEYKKNYYQPETSYNHHTSVSTKQETNDDIIIDDTNTSTIKSTRINTQLNTQENFDTQSTDMDVSVNIKPSACITPTTLPSTGTRINPFAKSQFSAKTPLNDSSKSVINEIEEKVSRQSAQKDKDTWKPTPPTKKLTKSKVSDGTPGGSINSFFGASPTIPKN